MTNRREARDPGSPPRRAQLIWAVGLPLLGALVAAALLTILVVQRLDPGTAVPTPTATVTTSQPVSPLPSASASLGTDLAWTQVASFEVSGDVVMDSVLRAAPGIVAIGTHYPEGFQFQSVASPAEGRVWLSADGSSWEDVTPDATFADATLGPAYTAADGAVVVFGSVQATEGVGRPVGPERNVAWESRDARSWNVIDVGLPSDMLFGQIARDARGYLALTGKRLHGGDLWLSADGRDWELVRPNDDYDLRQIGAGPEGFIVRGEYVAGDPSPDKSGWQPFVMTSPDGRTWIESEGLPETVGLASAGGKWFALTRNPPHGRRSATATIWSRDDGHEWSALVEFDLGPALPMFRQLDPRMTGVADLLVIRTGDSFPDVVGLGRIPGTQYVSSDGIALKELPFGEDSDHRILEVGGRLIAAGSTAGQPTFWIGEPG